MNDSNLLSLSFLSYTRKEIIKTLTCRVVLRIGDTMWCQVENTHLIYDWEVLIVAQWKRIRLGIMRWQLWSLASRSGLRIRCCHELWGRLQTRLRSGFAVAVVWASGCSSDWTPSLGTSICRKCGAKKPPPQKKNDWHHYTDYVPKHIYVTQY